MTEELNSNHYDIHAIALKKYRDLEFRNLLITKKEYQQLKNKYSIPKYIHIGITEGNKVDLYINAAEDLRELQKSRKLKTKVQVAIAYAVGILTVILLSGLAWYGYIGVTNKNQEERIYLAKEEQKGKLLVSDDFSSNKLGWRPDDAFSEKIANGVYSIRMQQDLKERVSSGFIFTPDSWVKTDKREPDEFYGCWETAEKADVNSNMILQLRIARIEGNNSKSIGLSMGNNFSDGRQTGYAFMMNKDGQYRFVSLTRGEGIRSDYRLFSNQGETYKLGVNFKTISSGYDSSVGSSHLIQSLKIVHNQYKVMLYCNDKLLASFKNTKIPTSGKIGLIVEQGLYAEFANIAAYSIGDGKTPIEE